MNKLQLFQLISLHHIWHNKLRIIFVLLIITIGSTSVFVAVDAIFKRDDSRLYATNLLHGRATISIEAETSITLDNPLLDTIRESDSVEFAAPLVLHNGLLVDQSLILPLIGIDPISEPDVRQYTLIEGDFISQTGQILITDVFAGDIAVGDTLRIAGQNGLTSLTVVGILTQESIAALNGGDMLFLHYQDVQAIRHDESIDFISVVHANTIDETLTSLDNIFPEGVTSEQVNELAAKTLTDYVIDVLGIITNGLPAVLGTLMITSTVAAGVAQRRKELAILRALGITPGGLLNMLVVEAVIIGLIGSVAGIGLAILLNQGALVASVSVEGLSASSEASTTPLWIYGFVIITSILMSVAAMWFPACQTMKIDATEAMRPPRIQLEQTKVNWMRLAIGIVFILLAIASRVLFDNSELVPMVVLTGLGFVLIGNYLIFPPFLALLSRRLPVILRRGFGFSGVLAAENLNIRNQRAMAAGLTTLLIIWFFILVNGAATGQQIVTRQYLENEFDWDLIVSGAGLDVRDTETVIPEQVIQEMSNHNDVELIVQERLAPYTYEEIDFTIRAIELDLYLLSENQFSLESGNRATVYTQLQNHEHPAVLIGGYDALLAGLRNSGETIMLSTTNGDVEFEIIGTILNADNVILMDYGLYTSLWNDTQVDRLSINFNADTDIETIRRNLSTRYRASGIQVTDREEILALFPQNATGSFVIAGLLFPFMMIGIANMLFISVLDRRREFGMLRAIGSLRGQILWSVILEAIILVAIACLIALPGAYLAMELMLFDRIVGIVIQPDPIDVLRTIALVMVVVAIAAYLPARRAARLDILDALRYE